VIEHTFVHFDPNPADRARPGSTLDSRQVKVVERLELIGQGPARFFRDACRVMNGEVVLDAATHTVAHYLREIDSAIRKVLEPMVSQERQAEIKAMKKGSHQAWIKEMAVVLGFLDPETVAARWTGVAGQLHDLAHRDALAPPRPIDDAFRRLWDEAQEIYELLSRQFASSFLATMPLIDALAAKAAPGETDASALRNTVPQSVVALDRFFGQLDSPAWLEPLRSHTDYFTAPTALSRGEDGSATYTPWPAGQYLVRMAALESERAKVIEIAIALETDNPEAHERVTEAALAMPPVDAARLVEMIGEFLQTPFQWALPMKATDLAKQLVAGGEVDAGLALLRAILAGPRVANDHWLYLHTLEESAEGFFPASGVSGVTLVADLLAEVIASHSETASESGDDHSYIWRQALEHGRRHDAKDVLVTALREALGAVAESDASIVPELVALLEARRHAIFHRLALDLLDRYPNGCGQLIAERLTTERLFADLHFRREYTKLAGEHFASLDPEQQQQILDWIERGRDDDDAERRDLRQLRELSRLGRPLPGEWERRYVELTERFGEYEERDVLEGAIFTGPIAPLSKDELANMPVADVLKYVREWMPEDQWRAPTPEGLARLLADVVAAAPVPYATAAADFADVDPTYARALLDGLQGALREGRSFDWQPVLELARIVLTKPRVIEGRNENNWDIDAGWKWTRKELAHLLAAGFQTDPPLPLEHAPSVFAILRELAGDPNPELGDEAEREGGMDPATLSLNTVRGAAFHALMGYVWWRAKSRENVGLPDDGIEPEVAELLELHLDPSCDPTHTIRSVYGQWFPYLATVDPNWAGDHVSAIFPRAQELAGLRAVAWETYVTFTRAYKNTFELLRDEYVFAIDQLDTVSAAKRPGRRDQDEALADHMMMLYGYGFLELDDPLLGRFFKQAPLVLRGHAIEFVGLSLENAATLDQKGETRFRALWEKRLTAFNGETGAEELKGFAWWFSSGKLDDDWSLTQLRALLESGGRVEPDHTVVERLAAFGETHLEEAVECLSLLIDTSDRRWLVQGSREEIDAIIRRGLSRGNGASRTAREIVNRLAAEGHKNFAELLQPEP
jgi:hypothetical protein